MASSLLAARLTARDTPLCLHSRDSAAETTVLTEKAMSNPESRTMEIIPA